MALFLKMQLKSYLTENKNKFSHTDFNRYVYIYDIYACILKYVYIYINSNL